MATPSQPPTSNALKSPLAILKLFLSAILFSLFYILGSYSSSSSSNSTTTTTTNPPLKCNSQLNSTANLSISPPLLDYEPHHRLSLPPTPPQNFPFFELCPNNFTNYMPCHDPSRENSFTGERFFYRERHCPRADERLKCLVPKPAGYKTPFGWPESRDYARFKNVPFKKLTVYKKSQNWVRLEGDRLVFPGGGTSFPMGVKGYVDVIKRIVPIKSGNIRTVLDVGCGVASFGAALLDYDILTMSIAPRDIHEAQVQFALERGLPAMLDGLYLMEIDRVLRPGGYWVLSGPPISWRTSYKGWERETKDLENEQISLEDLAKRLCWKKVAEKNPIAVWRKPTNHVHCIRKLKVLKSPQFCATSDPGAAWYTKMDLCITPLPEVQNIHNISGGSLEKWPKRLKTAPPRIRSGSMEGITVKSFNEDNQLWKKIVSYYNIILKSLPSGKHRNIMDMNAGLGGFAAALTKHPVWVMNVVPFTAKPNTLAVLYERGLIGTYMDWCEAFSTYPRTYDLIHANGVFRMYMDKCDIVDILVEMHRILRPEGAVIVRDHVDIIVKVKAITDRMRWNGKVLHSENGAFHPEKILLLHNSV